MDAVDIWAIVAPFATLAGVAWIAIMRLQYDLAMEDEKLTWWEVRCLFIESFKAIPKALMTGFKGFPFGTLLSVLLKMIRK